MVASVNAAFPGQTFPVLPTRTVLVLLALTMSFGLASEPAYFDYDTPTSTSTPRPADTTTPSDLAPGSDTSHKARHSKGKYTVREEVVRRMEATHPCQLTRTAVKVSFPDLKNEVLVSFIGYKEPNLMFVDRCKGLCSADAGARMACVPTRRSWRTVNMQMKTQMLGTGEVRERARELVLEEHESCACQCVSITPAHCVRPELFNNGTCACACDTHSAFRSDKLQCEAQRDRHWDDATCACRSDDDHNNNNPGDAHEGTYGCADCLHCLGVAAGDHASSKSEGANSAKGWAAAVACGAAAVFFAVTTAYYWRRSRRMEAELLAEEDDYHYHNTVPVDGSAVRSDSDKAETGARPVNGAAGASKLRLPLSSVALPMMPSSDEPPDASSSHHRKKHHRHKRRRRGADGANEETEQDRIDRIRRQNIEESLAPNFLDQIASPSGSLKFDC